jgi:hypothetical protein
MTPRGRSDGNDGGNDSRNPMSGVSSARPRGGSARPARRRRNVTFGMVVDAAGSRWASGGREAEDEPEGEGGAVTDGNNLGAPGLPRAQNQGVNELGGSPA